MKAKVKQLEWSPYCKGWICETHPGCGYLIEPTHSRNPTWAFIWRTGAERKFFPDSSGSFYQFPTESEAKAAAQAHWEKMILGCLEEDSRVKEALLQINKAHEQIREKCLSSPIYNAWGEEVSVIELNEAHRMASNLLSE